MDHYTCQDLEDPLRTLLNILKGHNEALDTIIKLIRTISHALEVLLKSSLRVVSLQKYAVLLLKVQIVGLLVYALWRVFKAVMRK